MRKIAFVVFAIYALSARAQEEVVHQEPRDNGEKTLTIEVPKSAIALEPIRYIPPPPSEFALSMTSWIPNRFERASYSGDSLRFDRESVPAISVLRYGTLLQFGPGLSLASKLGLGYLDMSRSATASIGQAPVGSTSEDMNLLMAHLGLELSWANLIGAGFEPNLSLAAMPTYALAQKSVFENEVSAFGVPVEATLGILWRARGIQALNGYSVGISGQAVTGTVGGSNMTGYGVEGEFRISL